MFGPAIRGPHSLQSLLTLSLKREAIEKYLPSASVPSQKPGPGNQKKCTTAMPMPSLSMIILASSMRKNPLGSDEF